MINLPGASSRVSELEDEGKCKHKTHAVTLKGKDENGNYKTMQAKEYPPRMNQLLADIALDFIQGKMRNLPASPKTPSKRTESRTSSFL